MNKLNSRWSLPAFWTLAAFLFVCGCHQKQAAELKKFQRRSYYTCSMHPQVHEELPGNCPICGMKLIRVDFTADSGDRNVRQIRLTPAQLQLAGITLYTVRRQRIGSGSLLTGTVAADESRTEAFSSRVAGRIERLFVRSTGEQVQPGRPVYAIYSEDLLESEKQYLLALQQQRELRNAQVDYVRLIRSAAEKLRLWGLSEDQLRRLAASGQASATVSVESTVSGTVTEIPVHEGDYVTEGMTILKAQDLSHLWVEAQAYAGEAAAFRNGQQVEVQIPGLSRSVNGNIAFINPELSDNSSIALLRVRIPNADGSIQPGMMAYVSANTTEQSVLAIPASAIIPAGQLAKVWIRNADGSFSPRYIRAALGSSGLIPVDSGLKLGEIIVDRGVYLLNSEDVFKNGNEPR